MLIKSKNYFYIFLFLITAFMLVSNCYAAHIRIEGTSFPSTTKSSVSSANILDSVFDKYQQEVKKWQNVIREEATKIFLALAAISLVWTFGQLLFQKSDITAFFGEAIRFMLFIGLFYWFLENGPKIAEAIIQSFIKIGARASSQGTISPSSIVDVGIKVLSDTKEQISIWSPIVGSGCLVIAGIVLVILALVGVNMLLQLITAWVLAYAGIIFLGFGGSRWTSDMALNYFRSVLQCAVSLMTMTLLVGIGTHVIEQYHASMAKDMNMDELSILLVFAITLLMLVDKLPSAVAGIATGSGIGNSGIGAFGAGAALGAAATALTGAAGAIKGAVAAGKAAGTTAGGGLAALKAACNAASQAQQMGTGAFSGMKPGASDDGSLVRAMHGSPAFCAELGKSLGSSMKSAAKDKMNSMKEKASNAINNSAGGKLAASINKETEAKSEKHMESLQSMSENQATDAKTQQQAQNYVDLASGNLDLNPGATPSAEAQNYVNFASGKMDLNDSQGEGGGDQTPQNDSNSKSE